jgi:fructokinase
MMQQRLYGGVEAGGTKFICAVGTGPDDVREWEKIDTTTPEQTLREMIAFFRGASAKAGTLDAFGIASFGPIDLHADSPTFGYITSTPKEGWSNVNICGAVREAFGVPVAFDTDVNGAALAEWRWGAAQHLDTFIYLTIGTGIGGGGMINGRLMHGLVHPEMGHVRIPRDLTEDAFKGVCQFHDDCLEGLASGPAIEKRHGRPADSLAHDHPEWVREARYLAFALVNFICTLSPQRIVMGGGVMAQQQLYPLVREQVVKLLNGYVRAPAILDGIDTFIVPPGLGDRTGVLGALALAEHQLGLAENRNTASIAEGSSSRALRL